MITTNTTPEETQAYVSYLENKHNRKLATLDVHVDGEEVDLRYTFENIPFERLRRITGYLVGTTERWNDAKKDELKDRVTHSILEKI